MGQHKTNPTAQAAKRGELSRENRLVRSTTPTHTERRIEPGGMYVEVPCVFKRRRDKKIVRLANGTRLERKYPKVKGKAAVKRAKKARRLTREYAELKAATA